MAGPLFQLVCTPATIAGAPDGWVAAMLEQGELTLLVDDGGLDAVSAVAHALDLMTVTLVRSEDDAQTQDATVMRYAAAKPLVWVAGAFGDAAATWAHDRGPMTLLVQSHAPLSDDERKRVERFVVILGRQAE